MKKLLSAAALVLLMMGCGSDPSGTQTIHQGSWSGMAADSIPVAFSVSGDSLENITLLVEYDMESHPDTSFVWVFSTGISSNQFQHTETGGSTPWEFGMSFSGTFTPPDQVQGTLSTYCSFTQGGNTETDSLSASWTAQPE